MNNREGKIFFNVIVYINGQWEEEKGVVTKYTETLEKALNEIKVRNKIERILVTAPPYRLLDIKKTIDKLEIAPGSRITLHGSKKSEDPVERGDVLSREVVGMDKMMIFQKPLERLVTSNLFGVQKVISSHVFRWEFTHDINCIFPDIVVIYEKETTRQLRCHLYIPSNNKKLLLCRPLNPLPQGRAIVVEFNEKSIFYSDKQGDTSQMFYFLDVEKDDTIRLVMRERNNRESMPKMIQFSKDVIEIEEFISFATKALDSEYTITNVSLSTNYTEVPLTQSTLLMLKDMDCLLYDVDENDPSCGFKVTVTLSLDERIELEKEKALQENRFVTIEEEGGGEQYELD